MANMFILAPTRLALRLPAPFRWVALLAQAHDEASVHPRPVATRYNCDPRHHESGRARAGMCRAARPRRRSGGGWSRRLIS